MRKNSSIHFQHATFLIVPFVITLILTGCVSSLPTPRKEDLKQDLFDTVGLNELFDGRTLYITKCSGCHSLYLPTQYSSSSWDTILTVMNPKAKVTNDEALRIRMYLTLYANKN